METGDNHILEKCPNFTIVYSMTSLDANVLSKKFILSYHTSDYIDRHTETVCIYGNSLNKYVDAEYFTIVWNVFVHVIQQVSTGICSVVAVGVLTCSALLHSMCNLKFEQLNRQHGQVLRWGVVNAFKAHYLVLRFSLEEIGSFIIFNETDGLETDGECRPELLIYEFILSHKSIEATKNIN